ncbi:hypothetical protein Tco_0499207 [Tanacetum coccineum]
MSRGNASYLVMLKDVELDFGPKPFRVPDPTFDAYFCETKYTLVDDAPVLDEIDDLETGEKREGDKTVDDNNEGDSVLENGGIKSFSYSGNVFESLMRINI